MSLLARELRPFVGMPIRVSFGSIVTGAFITAALLVLFAALASGIGLVSIDLEHGDLPKGGAEWGALAYGIVVLIFSFFIGGRVAARLSGAALRGTAFWHGLGTWSLVVVAIAFMAGSFAGALGGVLMQAGVGA